MLQSLNGQLFLNTFSTHHEKLISLRKNLGLIETMLFIDGKIPLWKYHFQRLFKSIPILDELYALPSEVQLLEWIEELIKENKIRKNCILRMEVYFSGGKSFYFIETKAAPLPQASHQNLCVGIASSTLKTNRFSLLKTTFRKPYEAAQKMAAANGWYDALLLNEHNRIVESTISNIFWVKDYQIFTPPLSEGCIEGVYRSFLIDQKNLEIIEAVLDFDTFKCADAIFLTNSIRGIQVMHCFENHFFKLEIVNKLKQSIF